MNTMESAIAWAGAVAGEMPSWLVTVLTLAVGAAIASLLHGLIFRVVRRFLYRRLGEFGHRLCHRVFGPTCLGAVILTLSIAVHIAPLDARGAPYANWALVLAFIVFIGWCAVVVVDTAADLFILQIYSADRPEVHSVIAEMRDVIDLYEGRLLIGEIYISRSSGWSPTTAKGCAARTFPISS